MVLTQIVRWADNTSELKRNLSQGLDQIEAVQKGAEKMVEAMRGDRLIETAHRMVAAIGLLENGVKALNPKEAASRLGFLERAIDKLERTNRPVPAAMRATADALRTMIPTDGLSKSEQILSRIWSGLKGAAGLMGVTFGVGAVVNFTKTVFDAASAIGDQSKALGFSAEAFQRYSFAAKQSGASQEAMARSAGILNDKLAEGDTSTVGALTKAGLKWAEIRAMRPEDAFLAVADAVGKISDPMLRANVAQDLFGKGARELLPGMIDGYKKLGDAATVMSDETIRRLKAAQDAWNAFFNGIVIRSAETLGALLRDGEAAVQGWGKLIADMQRTAKGFMIGSLGGAGAAHGRFLDEQFAGDMAAWIKQVKAMGVLDPRDLGAGSGAVGQIVPVDYVAKLAAARAEIGKLTSAQLEQLNAAQAVGDSFEKAAAQIGLSAEAAKVYASLSKDLTKTTREEAEAVKKMFEAFSGVNATNELNRLDKALKEMARAGLTVASDQVDAMVGTIIKLMREGGKVSPLLHDWMVAHLTLANSGLKVSGSVDQVTKAIRDQFGVLTDLTPGWLKYRLEIEKTLNVGAAAQKALIAAGGMHGIGIPKLEAPPITKLGDQLLRGLKAFQSRIADTVLAALTGGGSIGRSVGALAGSEIGSALARHLGKQFDKDGATIVTGWLSKQLGQLGDTIAAFLPGIGAMLGSLFGDMVGDAIGAIFGPSWRDRIREWADTFAGSIDGLREKMQALGTEGERLWRRLIDLDVVVPGGPRPQNANRFGARMGEDQTDPVEDIEAAFERLEKTQVAVGKQMDLLTAATQLFGGVAPRAMQPLIDSLLKSTKLTEAQRLALEALSGPVGIDALRQAAERYGGTIDGLGTKINQLGSNDAFDQLFADFTMFQDAGADLGGTFDLMQQAINETVNRARKMGLAIPEFMRPILQQMLEAGRLTDEFGNALTDLSGLSFSASIESFLDRIATILERIEAALAGPATMINPRTGEEILDTGRNAVPRPAGQTTVIVEMNGQTIARAITPWLPDEVRTLRLA